MAIVNTEECQITMCFDETPIRSDATDGIKWCRRIGKVDNSIHTIKNRHYDFIRSRRLAILDGYPIPNSIQVANSKWGPDNLSRHPMPFPQSVPAH